jgi:hypothetical protein
MAPFLAVGPTIIYTTLRVFAIIVSQVTPRHRDVQGWVLE